MGTFSESARALMTERSACQVAQFIEEYRPALNVLTKGRGYRQVHKDSLGV
jgi:hypothetical protein